MSKIKRQEMIEKIIINNNKGWRQAELARSLHVHRSTVGRDIQEMASKLPIVEKKGLIYIDCKAYKSNLELSIHEMLSLHFACSSMMKQENPASAHMASALQKISDSISLHSEFVSTVIENKSQQLSDSIFTKDSLKIQEKLNQAWVESKKVTIAFRSEDSSKAKVKGFIYSIESSGSSDGLMLFIKADGETQISSFAISRIQSVKLCDDKLRNPQEWLAQVEATIGEKLVAAG